MLMRFRVIMTFNVSEITFLHTSVASVIFKSAYAVQFVLITIKSIIPIKPDSIESFCFIGTFFYFSMEIS